MQTRGTRGRVAHRPLGECMEQTLAFLSGWIGGDDIAAQLPERIERWTQIGGQGGINLSPQLLRQGGAFTGGRDGDLQFAPAPDRWKVEVAIWRIVGRIAENAVSARSEEDGRVDSGLVGCGYHQVGFEDVVAKEGALFPREYAVCCELSHCVNRLGRNDPQVRARGGQRGDLFETNIAAANDQHTSVFEFEVDGEKIHSPQLVFFYCAASCEPCRTGGVSTALRSTEIVEDRYAHWRGNIRGPTILQEIYFIAFGVAVVQAERPRQPFRLATLRRLGGEPTSQQSACYTEVDRAEDGVAGQIFRM
jgi:hypothetical protein